MTRELSRCFGILVELLEELETVLPSYMAAHRSREAQRHDAAEASLFVETLKHRFAEWNLESERGVPSMDLSLSEVLALADQADGLAKALERHRADARLEDALARFAECLRLTGPAVLRWSHGASGGRAAAYIEEKARVVRLEIDRLRASLQAA